MIDLKIGLMGIGNIKLIKTKARKKMHDVEMKLMVEKRDNGFDKVERLIRELNYDLSCFTMTKGIDRKVVFNTADLCAMMLKAHNIMQICYEERGQI